jgi:hypothetical protein
MKHLFNDISQEEKNRILELHTGGIKVMIENFNKLVDVKLGDVKPYLNEQGDGSAEFRMNRLNREQLNFKPTVYDKCVPLMFSHAVQKLISEGYDTGFLKVSLGVIGRESDFGTSKRYNMTTLLKTLWAFVGGQTSVGPGQIKPETAKKYGLSVTDLTTAYGSIKGVYQIIKNNYDIALKNGYSNSEPSSNFNEGTGSAALDMAIISFNLGEAKITKYCKTNNHNIKKPCSLAGQTIEEQRFKMNNSKTLSEQGDGSAEFKMNRLNQEQLNSKSTPKKKITVTKEWVPNYLPNFKSERWDGVNISSHGYAKEVAQKMKTFSCF